MHQLDYIVVGLGIAGLCLSEELSAHGKSFLVFDPGTASATKTSGGVINPTVLKRFTTVWNASQHNQEAVAFYEALSQKLGTRHIEDVPILRVLHSVEEQNNWAVASDKVELADFLFPDVLPNTSAFIEAPYGFGKVLKSYLLKTTDLLNAYRHFLKAEDRLVDEMFEYDRLEVHADGVSYGKVKAKKIIFCEGTGALHNPWFPEGMLNAQKGEYLIIKAPRLQLSEILKGPMFIIPLGNDLYKLGATFDRTDKTPQTTQWATGKLEEIVSRMIRCPFETVDQIAGFRPTTKDRRPLLGAISGSPLKVFFTGLGTRGLMAAPSMAKILYRHFEHGENLPEEVNINRFL